MVTLRPEAFEAWLQAYRAAWENRDAPAAASLFSPENAEYYWTPFDPPQRGRSEIAAVWESAVSQQRDIHMTFEVLAVEDNRGIARWHTNFTVVSSGEPVQLDGVLIAEFDAPAHCRVFREWWHQASKPY
jgi:ketosteroid isomerase-like protein